MNYRSLNDLAGLITRHASRIDNDVDLVVGIPRSGMLAASIISLKLNLPLTDLYSFLRNDELKRGSTRTYKRNQLQRAQDARKILLVDDSVATGQSLNEALEKLRQVKYPGEIQTLAGFAEKKNAYRVDVCLEEVEQPRVFEWNVMHHGIIAHACLSIDGVLCEPPNAEQLGDDAAYQAFIRDARPLFIPSVKAAHLVTGRPEKYRELTEDWLARHGVEYGRLHMMEVPADDFERAPLQRFKADVYRKDSFARLYIERDPLQAQEIVKASHKPVYCLDANEMYVPGKAALMKVEVLHSGYKAGAKARSLLRKTLAHILPARPANGG
ncbi:phosphoribosyltransferase family protein [Stutzerimonas tarimensis]|uniref:Phosphoribosyltransferase family protein n=1 Tax=Stutzerimonas tarimensis TaxID=1507735 RepID=A0ABV7T5L1_9GAMM